MALSSSLFLAILGAVLAHRAVCVSPLASVFDSLDDAIHFTVKWPRVPQDGSSKESMVWLIRDHDVPLCHHNHGADDGGERKRDSECNHITSGAIPVCVTRTARGE